MEKCAACGVEFEKGKGHTCAPKKPDIDLAAALGNAINELRKGFEDYAKKTDAALQDLTSKIPAKPADNNTESSGNVLADFFKSFGF